MLQKIFGYYRARTHSLVARVRLSSRYDSKEQSSVYDHEYGTISDLGFAETGSFEIIHHAPNAEPVTLGQGYQPVWCQALDAQGPRSSLG